MKPRNLSVRLTPVCFLMVMTFVLSACGTQAIPTTVEDVVATKVVETMQAQATLDMAETLIARMTQQAIPTSTPTIAPTLTPAISATLFPTATQIPPTVVYVPPQPAATSTPVKLCLQATFVKDVSVPWGTKMHPGEDFTKTWQFQNTGSCTWTTEFDIFYVSGEQMSPVAVVDFPSTVKPGGTVDISIAMVAPTTAGTYTGSWIFADQGANRFGTGADGKGAFSVRIVVE
ncbi:MAG: NBR1-Ig-like domain-containing protein [Anaerolineaceae bacterium]